MSAEKTVTVREIMMGSPVTLNSNDILVLADDLMTLGRIRHIPIVEGETVVGVLSQRDLFRSAFVTAMGLKPGEQKDLLKAIPIEEVMSKPAITISPDAPVKEAARVMMGRKIGCLPVVEGDKLIGLVTETDILRYVANH